MRKQGLVKSSRGPGGGYELAQEAGDISISKIILAVDESVDIRRCKGDGNCHGGHGCITHDLWTDLSGQINNFLESISIGELMKRRDMSDTKLCNNIQL